MDYYLHALVKKKSVGDIPYLAIDFENYSEIGGAKSFRCAHVFGYYRKRRQVKYPDPVSGKLKMKDAYDLTHVDLAFDNRDKLCKFLLSLRPSKKTKTPCILIFFNAKYDYTFIQDICDDSKRLTNNGTFIVGRLNNGIKMLDIHNHFKASLEKAIEIFGMEEKKNNICGEAIFKTPIEYANTSMANLQEHNRWDTMATWEVAERFRNIYNGLGVDLKATAPSNALEIFRVSFFPENVAMHRIGDELNIFERKAYFGGRNEMFRRGVTGVRSYDVHSMYPSVMVENLYPDPGNETIRDGHLINSSMYHYKDGANANWEKYFRHPDNYLGIFTCIVDAPMTMIPLLPIKKIVNGAEKLIFPVGQFEGTWTSVELHQAEQDGVKILSCSEFVIYKRSIPLFKPYIDHCYSERLKAKYAENLPMSEFWKLMMNSLYGKFAEYHKEGGYFGKAEDMPDEIAETLDGKRVAPVTIDGVQYISVPADKRTEDSEHTFPCIPAFVTAYARLKLYRGAKAADAAGYRVVYCDTDSLKITTKTGRMPDDEQKKEIDDILGVTEDVLGTFGYEAKASGLDYFQGQKNYCPVNPDGTLDVDGGKWKGLNAKFIKSYVGNPKKPDTVTVSGHGRQPVSERMGIRRGIPFQKWIEFMKDLHGHGDKRVWLNLLSKPIVLTL